jgi:hypothetical protein
MTRQTTPALCDCERSHNGMGMAGRLCDCQDEARQTTPTETPCPDCGGQVVIHANWVQTCTACPWGWLPPSMRPLVRRPSIMEIVCV